MVIPPTTFFAILLTRKTKDRSQLGPEIPSKARSATLGAEVHAVPEHRNLTVRVKDEPRDDANPFSSNSAVGTRDPRKRPQGYFVSAYSVSRLIELLLFFV